ncbi:centrin-binding protein Sfi1, putative [Pseudozyma hubeiensis SY62]|uniref:Centrin-binding protein Sfi1, putative n=1 Tax=Pseudozyma hubeiensis (strain SY62) TaxID=1305764 RepID=R9PD10_PSEHS|nr:centrin-binding protein Sfi1, putative [Pseudozyma hubeiensis SY62]GAC95965.1 centrin-binding protein Sfi1, putative [Pseudozyma hubeiensis SY62]
MKVQSSQRPAEVCYSTERLCGSLAQHYCVVGRRRLSRTERHCPGAQTMSRIALQYTVRSTLTPAGTPCEGTHPSGQASAPRTCSVHLPHTIIRIPSSTPSASLERRPTNPERRTMMPRTHGTRTLQGRHGRGSARATTSVVDNPEPESPELSSVPTSDAEEGAEAAPPQPSTPQTSVAGGHEDRGWSTNRSADSRPLDISQAEMDLALALETIDRYDDSVLPARAPRPTSENGLVLLRYELFGSLEPTDGQPLWSFICENWPYGSPDRAINDIFQRALTLKVQKDTSKAGKKDEVNYCLIETTLRRLGFRLKDLVHVMLTFKVAFLVMLAVNLRRSGFGTISRNYKHTSVSSARIHGVLKTNPVIRAWMEPSAGLYNDLYEATSHAFAEGITDVAVEFAKQRFPGATNLPPGSAKLFYLRQLAKERHTAFVEIAIDAVMQQFWEKAFSTWLSSSKQSLATTKSQWEDLRTRCVKQHLPLIEDDDAQHEEGFWLPRFEVGMASAPESLIDAGQDYGADLNECRMQLQEAAHAEKARKPRSRNESKDPARAKRRRLNQPQAEFDELDLSSSDEEAMTPADQ